MAPSVADTEASKQIHPAAAAVERIKERLKANPNSVRTKFFLSFVLALTYDRHDRAQHTLLTSPHSTRPRNSLLLSFSVGRSPVFLEGSPSILTTLPFLCSLFHIEHSDPGLRANPAKPNLLTPDAKLKHLSPYLGTEISGVQLSQLSNAGLDELALFAAERKVLVFRGQDFKDIGIEKQIEIAKYFGPIQRHPTSGNVKGYPEFHVGECSFTHTPPPYSNSL
jgi:hypothetical protein